MLLWRISNHATLEGEGGLLASARWHTQGHPILYLAETPAGALVEVLVHLELDPAHLPRSYQLLKAEAPDDTSLRAIGKSELAEDWTQDLRSEEHTSELQSHVKLVCRLLLEKKKKTDFLEQS